MAEEDMCGMSHCANGLPVAQWEIGQRPPLVIDRNVDTLKRHLEIDCLVRRLSRLYLTRVGDTLSNSYMALFWTLDLLAPRKSTRNRLQIGRESTANRPRSLDSNCKGLNHLTPTLATARRVKGTQNEVFNLTLSFYFLSHRTNAAPQPTSQFNIRHRGTRS